jgi:hypothetical protein
VSQPGAVGSGAAAVYAECPFAPRLIAASAFLCVAAILRKPVMVQTPEMLS